jgi:DNA-binding CsgD family transcriptional regulator
VRNTEESQFLDLLYAAAAEPELWSPVMERFADMTRGTSGWLSRLSVADGSGSGIVTRIDPTFPGLYHQHYGALNPFSTTPDPGAFMRNWEPKVVTDADWLDKDELVRTEYYNGFQKPQQVHSCMIVRISAHDYEVSALTINRPEHWGPFEREDLELAERLRNHIRRAFELTARLGDLGLVGEGAAAALDQSPHAAFILTDGAMLRQANQAAEQLLTGHSGLVVRQGRLSASSPAASRQLDALVAAAASPDPLLRTGGSMALYVRGKRSPLAVTVAPIRSERLALFGHRPSVIVSVADPDAQCQLEDAELQRLFGFTPAEARVALALLAGATVREAAARLDVSYHTVRHQLQNLLDKTGTTRQAELIALLTRAGARPGVPRPS